MPFAPVDVNGFTARGPPVCAYARPRAIAAASPACTAEAIHEQFPGKLLAYNCSPSFNWKRHLDDATIAMFQDQLSTMGYQAMTAYVRLQEHEFELERTGYSATRHQREVGTGYFDEVARVISGGEGSTLALRGSTEEEQFQVKV